MTVPFWQPATLYAPGSVVRATTSGAPISSQVANGNFEAGDTGWTKGTGWSINSGDQPFQGTWSAKYNNTGTSNLDNDTSVTVTPGQSITLSCMVQQGASSAGQAGATIALVWLDATDTLISVSQGNTVDSGSGGAWQQSRVTASAPATAAKVFARVIAFRSGGSAPLWVDNAQWDYFTPAPPNGLLFKAVQSSVGRSSPVEPAWPTTNGTQVIDNDVIWEAISDTRIVWRASAIYQSGGTEPNWPTVSGQIVADGEMAWECVVRRVTDENCPNTKVVAIVASKVFAADGDIVRFSATANPLDWTSEQDAGYLPTGLQQANANDMAVLNQYRSNLVAFNASSFQNWYADPDPAAMSLLDQMDGIGSTWQQAAQSVGNELFYLSQLGVRSVGIANAAENLAAGDVGQPIDPLVRAEIATAVTGGFIPIATYYPGAGQYWLAFTSVPGASGIVLSNPLGSATLGEAVDHQYVVTGGTGPFEFVIDRGSLPPGLTMDSLGHITGTPTEAGEFAWRVRVYDSVFRTDSLDEGIDVVEGIDGGSPFEVLPPTAWGMVYGNTTAIFSPDGLDWSAVAGPGDFSPIGALWAIAGNGLFVVYNGGQSAVTSDGGTTWTLSAVSALGNSGGSRYGCYFPQNSKFYIAGGSNGIYEGSDGAAWTQRNAFVNSYAVGCSDTLLISMRGGASPTIQTSTDGAVWIDGSDPPVFPDANEARFASDGTKILVANGSAFDSSTLLSTTTNGNTWTPNQTPFAVASTQATACAYDAVNAKWVVGAVTGEIAYSTNGEDGWTLSATNVGAKINDIQCADGRCVLVADGGEIFTSENGGVTWTDRGPTAASTANLLAVAPLI